jgi:hypothetical protein
MSSYESFELLIEGKEPVSDWSICLICLQVDRTAAVLKRRWRCPDCGSDNTAGLQKALSTYLVENPVSLIERNLAEWSNVKGMRPAYKMLKAARFKCLITLCRREYPEAEQAPAPP